MTTRSTELLRVAHARPGVTRAEAARLLGVGTGAATEIVARLAQASLLAEAPAAPSGSRGRPTTLLVPHPTGPLVLAAAITHEAWRIDVVELGGNAVASVRGSHAGSDWAEVIAAVTAAISTLLPAYGERLRALGVSVPGTVSPDLRLDASSLGWHDVDLTTLWPGPVFVAGNDATLAAAAESARGAAQGAAMALHLRIEGGLGGAVVDHGRVLMGARGAGGEFGHMPFGDPAIICPCGARGCWGTAVDGTAMARRLGKPAPPDPVTYARRIIAAGSPVVAEVAAALGRGIAGLVNGLDADLVTLGGIGVDLLAAVPGELDAAYQAGLMKVHRASPPPIRPAALGDDGPIAGAGEEAWSRLLPELA
ncbi:putative NBD/HSP70 family sugar kinase [Actinoplanes tereljensis]|uniref:Xylose repressor n=1 Tax=Paractinoplanes tereljensis TaxID=571912 RepID=A0A919TXD2_9ACTN|nr:ROK family protein [Actinoplanes tereljensis]GIF24110.1 xylose repressor [Actinoplanes tereljensis]